MVKAIKEAAIPKNFIIKTSKYCLSIKLVKFDLISDIFIK